ncbi:hypothetical protein PHISCL_05599 [Aspergillus sclerotialis]|uniref:Uncharacterized protein n=1 Tax=Aspergillus sclerotialis TaxID=2070753 RepID=A0A3A2ZG20_9EURO|nr:hypothetical protein PHISCL_05599 [Aspergillus sclerotialis]
MPLASHLLAYSDRWRKPKYASQFEPTVLDLSPGVLGLSEGFRQAGFAIGTGLCFDPKLNLAWKAAYSSSTVIDGNLESGLRDIVSQTLKAPQGIPQGTPSIAILSIPNKGISKRQEQSHEDLKILDDIGGVLKLLKPDFLVFTLPSWVFHKDAYEHLINSIYYLLENRFCVHLKRVDLHCHGALHQEPGIVLLASSVFSPVSWSEMVGQHAGAEPGTSFCDKIQDLQFANSRKDPNTIVCRHPYANTNVYNHHRRVERSQSLSWTTPVTTSNMSSNIQQGAHTDNNVLTVRELARIQGFSDYFIFFGPLEKQYEDFIYAFPLPIAKKLADVVLGLIGQFSTPGPIVERNGMRRSQKRSRVDDADGVEDA